MDDLDPVFDLVAGYFAMLAEPTRLKIMHSICEGERTVNEIVSVTGIGQTNVSRDLGLMRRHGVVERRRAGNMVFYRVADQTMPNLCRAVCAGIAASMDSRRPLKRQLLKLVPGKRRAAA